MFAALRRFHLVGRVQIELLDRHLAEAKLLNLASHCRRELAKFKTPEYVWFMDEFPTTVTGKIQKFRLREMAIEKFNLHTADQVETA